MGAPRELSIVVGDGRSDFCVAGRADLVLAKTIGQGFDMGRPSILEASAEKKAGKVVATHIGGRCVPMMKGTIDLT